MHLHGLFGMYGYPSCLSYRGIPRFLVPNRVQYTPSSQHYQPSSVSASILYHWIAIEIILLVMFANYWQIFWLINPAISKFF